ncbi:MAG: cell surface protein SprA [Gemmatimonadales bacterium]
MLSPRAAPLLGALIAFCTLPRLLAAQVDTTQVRPVEVPGASGVHPGFGLPPFRLKPPAVLQAPWAGAPRLPPALRARAWDSSMVALLDSIHTEGAAARRYLALYGRPLEPSQPDLLGAPGQGVLGGLSKYADLDIDGQVRLEIRTERLRNERCSAFLLLDPNSGCRGNFKAPSIDNQATFRSGGVIGRRVHVNVDYDSEREFTANNNIQVYYEGLEDEIVRRIEVGTVTFQPPPSRFLTAAIPTNNFGVNARFEIGPLQIQTLAATQKGSQVTERSYTVGQTTSQTQDQSVRDLDFESGRFFWVVDPRTVQGYPALDILALDPALIGAAERPVQVRVYRYRVQTGQNGGNPNFAGITASARTADTLQKLVGVKWEALIQNTDYYLDPSGLWISLATKLDPRDYLAVSYVTAAGTTVGSFPSVDRGQESQDSLRLIVAPQVGPDKETFHHEMRQVYRVAGSELDPASLQVSLSVNRSERPQSGAGTYLSLLSLALPTDANVFDRENRLFPRARDPEVARVLRESYIVFPHLTPFADSTRLTPEERSDSLYRTPQYLLLSRGPAAKFQMRLHYDATGTGDRSNLSLGAFQIRDGSDQLTLAGRRLERGVDYTISYESGQVTFLNPESLFGSRPGQITARFEEQGVFAVAPTTILGLATSYAIGDVGALHLIGIYQREQSAFNRPPLGFEATANLIGGARTELHFKPQAINRWLGALTTRPATAPSLLDFNGEFAFTKPDPNRSGQAYIEEFEADASLPLSLRETAWEFGSRPEAPNGLESLGFAGGFDTADAVALTWQNLVVIPGTNQAVEVDPQDIDTLIRLSGRSQQRETVMYLTLHADTAGGIVQRNNTSRWSLPRRDFRPRWRSMVTPLSPTGLDLTQNEYLEFWVFQPASRTTDSAGVHLAIDLGKVDEDAVAVAPDSLIAVGADTTYTGRQLVGQGRLDTERNSIDIFNAQVDDNGILGDRPDLLHTLGGDVDNFPLCRQILSQSVPIFPWGDLSSRCSNGNGVLDTEDLDGDNVLNAQGANENVFRYVVSLTPGDKDYVRDGRRQADGSVWQLYRIPIRTPDAQIGTPDLRVIQQMRITLTGAPDNGNPDVVARFALARMRFVGSTWARRAERPIVGLAGTSVEPAGEVIATIISTENRTDLGYESPPDVLETVSRRGGDRRSLGSQINEKSLRLIARGLQVGDRGEAYLRFSAGPQNVLNYRQLRVWMRGRGLGWEEGDLQAFIKLGSDDRNFYLYRTGAHTSTWEPELVVDLEVWRQLRAEIETRWLSGAPPSGADQCGGLSDAYVACQGPYTVHLADPGINPPNLSAVQEVSAGIYRAAGAVPLTEAELWVDDIRLSNPISQLGTAIALDTRLTASDVGNFAASYVRQDGQFRQLGDNPTYRTNGQLQVSSNWRLDRFLPTSLGLAVPFTVSYSRAAEDPQLLTGTDLRADALPGLRRPRSWSATYSLGIRRAVPGKKWLTRALLDPLAVSANLTNGRGQTELSRSRSDAAAVTLGYNLQLRRRTIRLPFGGIVKGLPRWLRGSEAGKGLDSASFSLIPSNLRWSSGLTRNQGQFTSFSVSIERPSDEAIAPSLSLTHLWRNSGGLTWQPLGMLTLIGDLTSTRDLRVYPDSTSLGRLAYQERRFLLGIPVGVERDRALTTALSLTPRISSWLRPRLTTTSSFILSRTLTSRSPVREGIDSGAFILPQTLNNARGREIGASLDLSRVLRQIWGDSSRVGKMVARIRPVDFSTQLNRSSTYDLAAFDPNVGFMLGLGGLADFLSHQSEPARGAAETRTATLASGADLPFGLAATVAYSLTRTQRYQQVGDGNTETITRQREWPSGSLRWNHTFGHGPISFVGLGTTMRRREGTSFQPSANGSVSQSATSSSTLSPNLQLTFRNRLGLLFGLTDQSQRTETNGNATLLEQDEITGSLNYSFALPAALSRTKKQVRSTLSVLSGKTLTCLERPSDPGCTVVSDVRRREIRGGLDTDLMKTVSGGLQFGYSLNDLRHLNQRTSQIFVLMSFQLSLYAGDYR